MTSKLSLGFRRPSADSIRLLEYEVLVDGTPIDLVEEGTEEGWSYKTPVKASMVFTVDLAKVLKESGLPDDDPLTETQPARLGAAIIWKSSKTGRHGSSDIVEVVDGTQSISLDFPSVELGGTISFRLSIVLLENPRGAEQTLAPKYPGSRLWDATVSANLDRPDTHFPTTALSFKEHQITPEFAMWKLIVNRDLHQHASAAIRLLLNTEHPRIKSYLADPTALDSLDFQRFISADVTTQLIIQALSHDLDDLNREITVHGSLAEKLVAVHSTVFRGQTLQETKNIYAQNPSAVFSLVQSYFFATQLSS